MSWRGGKYAGSELLTEDDAVALKVSTENTSETDDGSIDPAPVV